MEERVLELHRSKWRRRSTGDVSQFRGVESNLAVFQCIDEGHLVRENVLSQRNINHRDRRTVWNDAQLFSHLTNNSHNR